MLSNQHMKAKYSNTKIMAMMLNSIDIWRTYFASSILWLALQSDQTTINTANGRMI